MRRRVPRGREPCHAKVHLRRSFRVRSVNVIRHRRRANFIRALKVALRVLGNVDMNVRSVEVLRRRLQDLNDALPRGVMINVRANCRVLTRPLRRVTSDHLLTAIRVIITNEGRGFRVTHLVLVLSRRQPPRRSVVMTLSMDRCLTSDLLQDRLINNLRMRKVSVVNWAFDRGASFSLVS